MKISATPGLHRAGGVLHPVAAVEAARLGAAHQGQPRVPDHLHPGHCLHHRRPHDCHAGRNRYEITRAVNETSRSFTMPFLGLKSAYWSLKGLSQLGILV